MIDRRTFLAGTGAVLLAAPLAAEAQARKVSRIGFLGSSSASGWASRIEALRAGLRELGHNEGTNIVFEFRWADGKYARLPELAAELVRLKVDVLVTHGTPGTLAAKEATRTIPIVMVHSGDAVATGLVIGLSRPGGNVTGATLLNPELMAKRLELLKEAIPRITQVAVLLNRDNPAKTPVIKAMEITAESLKIALHPFEATEPNEFDGVLAAMARKRAEAVVVLEDSVFIIHAKELGDLAKQTRLFLAGFPELAGAGSLIGYGANYLAMYRHAAVFVDKILKGAKPADLPVEQPTKFDLVINLKTAKALGLTIPPSLLARADEVIQ